METFLLIFILIIPSTLLLASSVPIDFLTKKRGGKFKRNLFFISSKKEKKGMVSYVAIFYETFVVCVVTANLVFIILNHYLFELSFSKFLMIYELSLASFSLLMFTTLCVVSGLIHKDSNGSSNEKKQ